PVNDAPVSENSTIAATEDTVAKGLLAKATDVDGDALTYALATNAANGKVIIGKDGSYTYTPNANFNGKDSFTYTINDGKGGVITQTATVNVAAVNDAPVSANTTIAATEDTVAKGLLAKATDVDGDALTYALATNAANGKVIIGKDGSYTYTPNANFNGKDSFTYTIDDGQGGVITQTATISVAAVNDAPVSEDSTIAATEDTVATGQLAVATDVDGDALTYAIATGAANGQVVIGKDGSYSYTPNANFNGKDSFTYTINDGKGGVITQTATVNVAAVNDAPEITALEKQGFSSTDINYQSSGKGHGHMAVTEDGKIVVAGQSNEHGMIIQRFYPDGSLDRDFGENGIAIAGSVFSDDIRDILVTEDGKILITAADGYGASEKDFLIGRFNSDGSIDNSFADNGVIQMDFDGGRDSAYNLVPLDGGRFLVTGLGTNFKGNKGVLLTVFDSDGNLDSSFNPSGTGTGQPGTVHYDKFSGGMYDNGGARSEASLVTHDGDIVVAIRSNSGLVVTKFNQEGELLASNIVESQLYLNLRIKEGADGKLIIGGDLGSKSIGVARFNSDLTQDITFNTRIESMQDVIDGELVDIEYEVGGDIYTDFDTDNGVDNQLLDFTDLQLLDDGKILVTGRYTYADYASSEYSNFIFFSKYNADGTLDKSFNSEGDFRGKPGVLVTDFELGADGYSVQYDIEVTSSGEILLFGVVENQEQRSFDSILVKFDINGNQISDFGPAIGIKATQDSDLIMKVDDFNFSDSDGNQLKAVIIDTLPESGDLLLNGASISTGQVIDVSLIESGKLIYRSETDIKNDQDININYRVQDNGGTENGGVDISEQGTLVIKVIFSNNIPVSKDSIIAATEDNAVSGKLEAATDADGDTLTYAIATGAANGKVVIGKDGSYTYTPNANFNGKDSFTYTINDGQGGVITQTATVNVAAVNDAPVSEESIIGVAENIIDTGVLTEATDVDGDTLTYALLTEAVNGTVIINANGSYSYTPNTDFKGEDSFTYTVNDGQGGIITRTANVNIAPFDQKSNFELQEVFETTVVSEQQIVVEKQTSNYINEVIEFEITGQNGMPQLELVNGSNVINGYYSYELQGPGISSSTSGDISSVGSNNYSIDFSTVTLPPGKYTMYLYVDSQGSSIDFNITEFKDVESTDFTGYQEVTGNIFADESGTISTPQNYEIQIDGQSLVFETGSPAASPIILTTDNGKLTLAADGSYTYRSDRKDLGLEAEKLAEDFYVKVIDLDTKQAAHYGINITSDVTPPESGELLFNNFEDTGLSQADGITQDNTFDLTVESNEAGSQVEYQYSTDQGVTWQVLANGTASDLADGDYSFRAKVKDEALNESFTAVKDITIDTTAPILGDILNFNTATNQLEVNADIDQDTLQAFKLENGALVPIADASNIPFAEGNYQIKASDVAGNSTTLDFVMSNASEYFESADIIDIVKGSAGNDYIYGGNGDDILISNGGDDALYG
ncbi:tandem-95 repeat protein, partial [Psychrobacter faecalis]|uniref:tandem-95 repeat protein n=1 Tax=Psychrobacter faecalis TaxID=180588 RepID=UPI003FCFB9C4